MYKRKLAQSILDDLPKKVSTVDPALLIAILTLITEIVRWYISHGRTADDFIKDAKHPSLAMKIWLRLMAYKFVTSKFDLKGADVVASILKVADMSSESVLGMLYFEVKVAERG